MPLELTFSGSSPIKKCGYLLSLVMVVRAGRHTFCPVVVLMLSYIHHFGYICPVVGEIFLRDTYNYKTGCFLRGPGPVVKDDSAECTLECCHWKQLHISKTYNVRKKYRVSPKWCAWKDGECHPHPPYYADYQGYD